MDNKYLLKFEIKKKRLLFLRINDIFMAWLSILLQM